MGIQQPSQVFGLEPRPPQISESELWANARFIRPALLGKVKGSTLDEESQQLWDITMDEVSDLHWMTGPYSIDQVHSHFGDEPWIPVRRFGVMQTSGDRKKLRPIDDFAENRVNTAYGYSDKLDLRTLDQMVWMTAALARAISTGKVCFRLSSGALLEGDVHPEYLEATAGRPLLSVLDLSSAYKQFAIGKKSRRLAVVTLKDPLDGCGKCFLGNVLPFGAAASVVHFNRISRLVHHIGLHAGVLWGSYFDDFPMLSPAVLGHSSMEAAKFVLDLLGFQYADHKLKPFEAKATVLGVEIDTSMSDSGSIIIRNKPHRVEEIAGSVQRALQDRYLGPKAVSKVLGRIQFADAQVMGRSGKIAMQEFRASVKNSEGAHLDEFACESLRILMDRLEKGEPRRIPCSDIGDPVLIFTDGASEADGHTIGGVLLHDGQYEYFSCEVPRELVEEWSSSFSHFIGLVELYAVLVARCLWGDRLAGARAIFFIDNNSAMDACIKGSSQSAHVRRLLLCWEKLEERARTWTWFSRVPSQSNPADEPSRSCHDLMQQLRARRVMPVCPLLGIPLVDL